VADSIPLEPWANIGLIEPDEEVTALWKLQQALLLPAPSARRIRELITRLKICHFKFPRHLQRIMAAIGTMRWELDLAQIGQAHPRKGPQASLMDTTGRSQQAESFIAALEGWLAGQSPETEVAEEVWAALGSQDDQKVSLVAALARQLRWQYEAGSLGPELSLWDYQLRRTHQCHYTFPQNVRRLIEAIGRGKPLEEFEGCGSFSSENLALARSTIEGLYAWLTQGGGPLAARLGHSTPEKEWLARCLRYTLIGQTTPVLGRRGNAPIVASLRRAGAAEALPPFAALEVRPLRPGDELRLLAFYRGLSRDTLYFFQPYVRIDAVQMAEAVRLQRVSRERHWVVADEQGAIVGHAFLSHLEESIPQLWLGLADEYQGLGLGGELLSQLIRRAQEILRRQGVRLSVVASNTRALRLCKRLGFARLGERSWQRSKPFPGGMVTSVVEMELRFAGSQSRTPIPES